MRSPRPVPSRCCASPTSPTRWGIPKEISRRARPTAPSTRLSSSARPLRRGARLCRLGRWHHDNQERVVRTNPFYDTWLFLIGSTDDHNALGIFKYVFVALFL